MKTVVKKGKAPVDEKSGRASKLPIHPLRWNRELNGAAGSHHVYVDDSGTVWDATLNQTNVGDPLRLSAGPC